MRTFTIGENVSANVQELRRFLGSISKPLSFDDLATIVAEKHPTRRTLNGTTVMRWADGTEPDIASIAIMANLAGVSFEEFALGKSSTWSVSVGEEPLGMVAEAKKPYGAKPAPIEAFEPMSSKKLEAEKKKSGRKKA